MKAMRQLSVRQFGNVLFKLSPLTPVNSKQVLYSNAKVSDEKEQSTFLRYLQSKWETPSKLEVECLKEAYPDPFALIQRITQYGMEATDFRSPEIHYENHGLIHGWRVTLKLHWPFTFTVTSQSCNKNTATENAYLTACRRYNEIGITDSQGNMYDFKQKLLIAQERFKSYTPKGYIRFASSAHFVNGKRVWDCVCEVTQPVTVQCKITAESQGKAESLAAALVLVKLKALNTLDKSMNVKRPHCLFLPKANVPQEEFCPDFEIHTDGSIVGYGAYIQQCQSDDQSSTIHWFFEEWPDEVSLKKLHATHSTFIELYAVVAACYTWKKKLENKNVLCWTDNKQASKILNEGFVLTKKNSLLLLKLYKVLYHTCVHYNINLQSSFLKREKNTAADHLSRYDVENFRKEIPNAAHKAKISKKLLFCLPYETYLFDESAKLGEFDNIEYLKH